MLKTIATGLSWSDRDVTAGRSAEGHSLLHCPGAGARKHGEPNQPSRLPEAAARPTSSLRVPGVRALRVRQRYASCAARDLHRELPASCRRQTPARQHASWGLNQRDCMSAARVPRSCRSTCFDTWIDIPNTADRLIHLRCPRRRCDLDQSSPILRGRGPTATSSFKSMEQIKSF